MQESRQPSVGVKERLKDADDESELGIVKDMMLAGYDSPAAAYPVSGPAAQGGLLIQTLARVNRAFRGNEDELLANRLVKAEVNPGPLNLSRGRGA